MSSISCDIQCSSSESVSHCRSATDAALSSVTATLLQHERHGVERMTLMQAALEEVATAGAAARVGGNVAVAVLITM